MFNYSKPQVYSIGGLGAQGYDTLPQKKVDCHGFSFAVPNFDNKEVYYNALFWVTFLVCDLYTTS